MKATDILLAIVNEPTATDFESIFKQRYRWQHMCKHWVNYNGFDAKDTQSAQYVVGEIANFYHELSQRPVIYQRDKIRYLAKTWLEQHAF